jgi:protein-tyrosine phosphatase
MPAHSKNADAEKPVNRLLFLCTGNYYRSRFAEILFNAFAARHQLPWRADSRGLALDLTAGNLGPMAQVAAQSLRLRGIRCASMERFPRAASEADFLAAQLTIALDEEEHRPLMRARFPAWENQIDYWLVHDLDQWDPLTALAAIENCVGSLVENMRENPSP